MSVSQHRRILDVLMDITLSLKLLHNEKEIKKPNHLNLIPATKVLWVHAHTQGFGIRANSVERP